MIATVPYVQERVEHFNRLCFGGVLPPIPVKLYRAKSYLGKVCYKYRRGFFGRILSYEDFVLRISTFYDLDEAELEDIILHELIHYYIAYKGIRDTSTHGREFRRLMKTINSQFGRHITISRRRETLRPL